MEVPVSTSTVKDTLIPFYANFYGISEEAMDRVVRCESRYQSWALNNNPPKEYSVGLVQINLLAHPNIPAYQAYNAFFALDYLARGIKYGTDHWTCQTLMGG
jgi:hypothetical protein